jgi:hypothetical protein
MFVLGGKTEKKMILEENEKFWKNRGKWDNKPIFNYPLQGHWDGAVIPLKRKMTKIGNQIGSIIVLGCPHIKFVDYVHYDHPDVLVIIKITLPTFFVRTTLIIQYSWTKSNIKELGFEPIENLLQMRFIPHVRI